MCTLSTRNIITLFESVPMDFCVVVFVLRLKFGGLGFKGFRHGSRRNQCAAGRPAPWGGSATGGTRCCTPSPVGGRASSRAYI